MQQRKRNSEGRSGKEWSCWRHGTLDGIRTGHSENDIFSGGCYELEKGF